MLFQLRSALAYRYFAYMTRGLDGTPPLASSAESPCEVHTMLGARDVTMYLLAIKSLLSHLALSVVVHSDGTLTADDVARVRRHVDGVRIVGHDEADARATDALSGHPLLAEWRRHDAAYRRLVDVEIWRTARRVIILDSDVLTNRYPYEVAAWVQAGDRPFLLGQASQAPSEVRDSSSTHVQAQFLAKVPQISTALGTAPLFIQGGTAGFCGYLDEMSLARIEAALAAALAARLPMQQWGGDQCLVIYLLSTRGAQRLPGDRYLNFDPAVQARARDACVIHFYGTHRFRSLVYPRLAADAVRRMFTASAARRGGSPAGGV
jgi:hypothetical protein